MKKEKAPKKPTVAHEHAEKYLKENKERGLGAGVTVSTWISQHMAYNRYSDAYTYRLKEELITHPEKCFEFISAHGGTAYYPMDMMNEECEKKCKLIRSLNKMDPLIPMRTLVKKATEDLR